MQEFDYQIPGTLQEACRMLLEDGSRPAAGCTDVLPQMRRGRFKAKRLIDLSRLDELHRITTPFRATSLSATPFIEHDNDRLSLGALVTFQELLESDLDAVAPALVQAAASFGCLQTRNRATLGGNLGNASPAGDSLPPMLVMNAEIRLFSLQGERCLPLADFLVAPGRTALRPGEVIRQVDLESVPPGAKSAFLKLGNRQGMAISVASVAFFLRLNGAGVVNEARLALGAVAPTAMRCPKTETFLAGQILTESTIAQAASIAAQECSPIDDVRASAAYRRHAVQVLVKRGLQACLEG